MPNVVPFRPVLRLKLNSFAGSERPAFRSKSLEWRAGMQFAAFQLETAETQTPASLAAALGPPTRSTMSPTERLMRGIKFRKSEKSSVQRLEIDNSQSVKFSSVVVRGAEMADRDEIAARVRQLPDILGKKDGELSELCGVTPQQWSNYKADGAHNIEFPWRCALTIWNAYGIPMEWIYDGQTAPVSDVTLREKLTIANHKAQAWLSSRHKPRRGSHIVRIAVLVVAGALFSTGGVVRGHAWKRADGHPMLFVAFVAERAACYHSAGITNARDGINESQRTAFYTCMDQQGYAIGE